MNRKIILLLIVVTLFLGGCTLAPRYTRPEAPVPYEWPAGEAYKEAAPDASAPKAAELPWRDFIADKSCRRL